jgi:L-fucose isomerase-like protein
VLQVGTFPDGDMIAAVANRADVPVVLCTVNEDLSQTVPLNSTCGGMFAGFIFREQGMTYLQSHVDTAGPHAFADLMDKARTAVALGALAGESIALVGEPPPGFLPCEADIARLQQLLGVRPQQLSIELVVDAYQRGARRSSPHASFPTRSGGSLDPDAVRVVEGMYGALSEVLAAAGASIAAVRDWPELLLSQPAGSAWPALGWLQDADGIVVGPERDVHGALTLAIERGLTGEHGFLGDVAQVDPERNEIAMWHYGASESLKAEASKICWADDGRELDFWLRPGPCAVGRLGLDRGRYRLVCFEGQVTDRPARFGRAGAYVQVSSAVGPLVERLRNDGWEHHLCLSYGATSAQLCDVARLIGIESVSL